MRKPGPVKAYLIDIEGVLVRNKAYEPVAGSVEWMAEVARRGIPFCLVSNNTTDEPENLIARLNGAGFDLRQDHLVGALGLGRSLLQDRGHRRILWLGSPSLGSYWERAGFTLADRAPCDAVVLGVNPDLRLEQLDAALPALLDGGVDLICLHRNRFYLDAADRRRLGPGAWSAALEALGGKGRIVTVGKPDPRIYREALKRIGVEAADTLFISDDPVADLVTAGRLGMHTAFVLSGKHADHDVLGEIDQGDWPDQICGRMADLAFGPEGET